MKIKNYNSSWKYWEDKNAFALIWQVSKEAKDITLPHDAMMEQKAREDSLNKGNTGFRDGAVYHYSKMLYAPLDYKNKTVMLKFEGIYMNSYIYVNGELAAKCPYGYTSFYVKLNNYLKYGEENEIRVIVRNGAMANSRWYSGGGIYRDVYLLESNLTYIVPDGVMITTDKIEKDYSVIHVKTQLANRAAAPIKGRLETSFRNLEGKEICKEIIPVSMYANKDRVIRQRIVLNNPKLWTADTPNLYQCVSVLYLDDNMIDENSEIFGVRTLQLDAKDGLRINGSSVKLRGACIHHDSGLLGAATYEDAQYRQISLLKEAGFNAVRMSHQPMEQAMLRACDELGMYVMDESFDMWTRCKSDYDYGMYFDEWWEKDVEAMVKKDYNHPCVLLYSIGNEIPEIATSIGVDICHKINEKIKELDQTRYTLASINGVFAAGDHIEKITADVIKEVNEDKPGTIDGNVNDFLTIMDKHMDRIVVHPLITDCLEKACVGTDIAGYNYMTARYETDGATYPNRIIVGSETYPPEIARNWGLVNKLNHVIGDFTWTGWDYIGEAGVGIPAYQWGEGGFGAKFPCQLAYCGDFDITGKRRPASYFRELVFGLTTKPYITVQNPYRYGERVIKTPWVISDSTSSWTWKNCDGKNVIVEVYSGGTEVELISNGKSLGMKKAGQEVGFITLFETIYEKGILTAISYENNKEIGRSELSTASENDRKLVIDCETGKNKELIYVPINIEDAAGIIADDIETELTITVKGDADLIGFGTGNPKPEYSYNENITITYQGCAMAVLKTRKNQGEIDITVASDVYETINQNIKF